VTPRARAEALCEAGELAVQAGARWTAAVGFFLRAMNADPTWPDAVDRMVAALHKRRARALEQILWRRLAHVPWDGEHRAALRSAAAGLGHLHERDLRDPAKAVVLKRLSKTFE
jgi:hypothetical protein